MTHREYVYSVVDVVRVVDGDSVDLLLEPLDSRRPVFATPWQDEGFHVSTRVAWFIVDGAMSIEPQSRHVQRVRLLGVDTPERGQPGWAEATAFTQAWLADAGAMVAVTSRSDSFGRYLADVRDGDGMSLSSALLAAGHAVPWSRRQADDTAGGE